MCRLGSREVHAVSSRRERRTLEAGHDAALTGRETRAFFRSTPFLAFIFLLLAVAATFVFYSMSTAEVQRMNEVPKSFVKRAAQMQVPDAARAALH